VSKRCVKASLAALLFGNAQTLTQRSNDQIQRNNAATNNDKQSDVVFHNTSEKICPAGPA
jgi:hypothetical protein